MIDHVMIGTANLMCTANTVVITIDPGYNRLPTHTHTHAHTHSHTVVIDIDPG
jgi:hypothetical protein